MKELEKLPKFIHHCMTIGEIPTSYKYSLTYEEQLMWFCKFLQDQVIPVVNNNSEAVQELQTFVENYFNNLDVQEEINNKLEEMLESGQLEEIITEYLNIKGMLTFNTLSEMKQATNLIDGSKAVTLGYYSLNDGGGAVYSVREVINTDVANDKDIIALSDENLVAVYINDTPYLNVKQFGAHEDGETDDYTILNYCLTYARANNLILQLNKETYLISDTFEIDIAKDKIEGNNANILFTGTTLFTFKNTNNPPYYNCYNIMKDLRIKCNKEVITGTICFDLQNATSHISHISFENINIENFEIGVNIYSNAYLVTFIHSEIFHCSKCIYMASGGTNYGERISFIDCTIYNSSTAIENNNGNGAIFLTNTSVDYNTIATKTSGVAQIEAVNSHFEGRQQYIGNAKITNSEIVILKINEEGIYLFETYANSLIQFNNCHIAGENQEKNLVSNDLGIVEFNNCQHNNYSGILANMLNDKSLSFNGFKCKMYTGGTADNTNYHTATNGVAIYDTENIKFTKQYGSGSNSALYLVFPRNKTKKRYRIQFDIKTTSQAVGTAYITHRLGRDISWNGKNLEWVMTKNLGDLPVGMASIQDFYPISFQNNSISADDNDEDIVIGFNFNNILAGDILIKNIKLQEW